MPQCPICNTAIWVGQQYCTTCDHPLPRPEPEDHFCPQCGLRLAGPQETCQECEDNKPEITGIPITTPAKAWRLPLGGRGLGLGAGLIILALLLFYFSGKSPEPPQRVQAPAPQSASEPVPAAPPVPASEAAPPAPKVAAVPELTVPPATAASVAPEGTKPTPAFPRYLVNIDGLYVRNGPDMSAPHIATLNFKDEVELLETSGGWGKVRHVQRDIVGWSYMRYLQPVAAAGSLAVSRHQAPVPQEPETISAEASKDM
jgi:hypothetical protein